MNMKQITSILALLLCCTACGTDYELPAATGDEATITLALQLSGDLPSATRSGLSTTDEVNIETVDVLLFRPNGGSGPVYYRTLRGRALSNPAGHTKRATVDIPISEYQTFDIDVLTNARDLLAATTLTPGDAKQTTLDKFTTSLAAGTKWTSNAIPMWGEATLTVMPGATRYLTVNLSRMVARIDVKNNAASGTFVLNSVYLYNYSTRGTLAPNLSAWSVTEQKATAPNPPAAGYGTTQTALAYTAADQPASASYMPDSLVQTIYTFEAPAGSTSTLSANTCLVLGGYYNGSSTETFYRVDFTTPSGSTVTYLPLLRNHRYTVSITSVSGAGCLSAADAFANPPTYLTTDIAMQAESDNYNVLFDGNTYLSVDKEQISMPCGIITDTLADNRNRITLKTDVATGWSATLYADAACTTPYTAAWLRLHTGSSTGTHVTGTTTGTIHQNGVLIDLYTTAENTATDATDRTAYVSINAGRLSWVIKVTQQRDVWAYSNIIYSGGKLIFAESAADNATIPGDVQGLMFKFGSLVALHGVLGSDGTRAYAPDVIMFYPPDMTTPPTTWYSIPYTTTGSTTAYTVDQFITDYPGTGYDAAAGIGDICRYISDQGWVKGKWRTPTSAEQRDLTAQQITTSIGTSQFDYTWTETDGTHRVPVGYLLGANAVDTDMNYMQGGIASTVRFFPCAGYREMYPWYQLGQANSMNFQGNYNSCTPHGLDWNYRIWLGDASVIEAVPSVVERPYAHTIRCIRQ
jgi:hypothetical protein